MTITLPHPSTEGVGFAFLGTPHGSLESMLDAIAAAWLAGLPADDETDPIDLFALRLDQLDARGAQEAAHRAMRVFRLGRPTVANHLDPLTGRTPLGHARRHGYGLDDLIEALRRLRRRLLAGVGQLPNELRMLVAWARFVGEPVEVHVHPAREPTRAVVWLPALARAGVAALDSPAPPVWLDGVESPRAALERFEIER